VTEKPDNDLTESLLQPVADEDIEQASQIVIARLSSYSGPLPPPAILAQYESLLPGAIERLFSMTEKEQAHRFEIEKLLVQSAVNDRPRGRYITAFISATFIAASCYMAHLGYPAYAVGIMGANLAALTGAYVYGTRRKEKPRQSKVKAVEDAEGNDRKE
jgi:uncharacterized membrane protein